MVCLHKLRKAHESRQGNGLNGSKDIPGDAQPRLAVNGAQQGQVANKAGDGGDRENIA